MDIKKNQSEELNINDIFLSLSKGFNSFGIKLYQFLRFLLRKKIIIISLLIIGFISGFFIDNYFQKNRFKHEIIVTPNVNSQPFLYKEVNSLKFKPNSAIKSVEIEPIVDVFNFMSQDINNIEIAKFLADNNVKLVKHSKGNETEQVYKYHTITFYSNNFTKAEKEIDELFSQFNNEIFYKEKLKINRDYIKSKIHENDISIANINNIFSKLGTTQASTNNNVNIEVFNEVNKLMDSKQNLLAENKKLKNELIENNDIVFKIANLNASRETTSSQLKFILPIVFLLIFFCYTGFQKFSNKYKHLV
ncbi:hypothetical protein HX088_03520 [Empedobacter sp. 225-1]|uniref:hypothetical protein n=1 Tax=unclassified Empedobacter TaxID=2643773 RepID=UPI002576EFDA|nr:MULTISPECIES: hypothetical protein [unclassified Empedobacter]MDM1522346.1 hypothetical protein [Empedobacter sp. 225-1]MDM1541843.1 hypothetical protein [Empedobacter sp. 189-2]